jgi:ribosomal protein S18 acetylase RimI-like enzyme
MKSCHFRPFEATLDKETVKGFLADTLRIGCDEPVNMEENAASYFAAVERAQSRDRRFCSMLLEGDEVVGFVDVFTMPKKPGSGFMRFCYVVPERRGCGVSDRIIDFCVELLSEYGCSEILLDVRADNKRAVGFYARHGWVVREGKQEGFLRMGRFLKARNETNAGCEP